MTHDRKLKCRRTAAGGLKPDKILYCSFCLKSEHDVEKVLSGHGGFYICGECVQACNEIIAGRSPDPSKRRPDSEWSTKRLLERLQAIEETLQGKGNQLQVLVDLLRSREVSWAQIGAALGISRQSAWERFG